MDLSCRLCGNWNKRSSTFPDHFFKIRRAGTTPEARSRRGILKRGLDWFITEVAPAVDCEKHPRQMSNRPCSNLHTASKTSDTTCPRPKLATRVNTRDKRRYHTNDNNYFALLQRDSGLGERCKAFQRSARSDQFPSNRSWRLFTEARFSRMRRQPALFIFCIFSS